MTLIKQAEEELNINPEQVALAAISLAIGSNPLLVNEDENSESNSLELPHNIEAEQQLLGALIRNNDLIEKCNNTRLSGEHFYNKLHGEI